MVQTTNIFWLNGSNPFLITTPKPLAFAGGFFMRIARANLRKSFSCEPGQTVNFRRTCRAIGSRLKGK
ncbi:hypothetical protein, partial [Kluyvera intermedia]|uniref:hypothetical protein n=1 Tax=Kluyvera intermedia TaxID=61648 RepID=UPI001C3FE2AE